MNRTLPTTSVLVVTALLASACSGGDDETSTSTSPTDSSPSTTVGATTTTTTAVATDAAPVTTLPPITTTTIPDVLRMPLTGEPIDDESEIPDRPALVVKLTNAGPDSLPQAGLNRADIVFEEVINDQVTRLAAVYHTQDSDPVGPVRSGRAQDINLMLALNRPLFAWSGGNAAVRRAVRDSDLVDLDAGFASGYYRRSGRRSPNNLYSSTEALWAQTPDDAEPPGVVFPYLREGEALTGSPATEIEIRLDSTVARWEFDPETQRYFRWQNGREHETEEADGIERVWADNVVVMMANYGRNSADGNPDAQVLGSNPVFIFTGGTVRSGTWLRFEPTDRFGFFDNVDDLNELGLQPGRTWVEIPRNSEGNVSWS